MRAEVEHTSAGGINFASLKFHLIFRIISFVWPFPSTIVRLCWKPPISNPCEDTWKLKATIGWNTRIMIPIFRWILSYIRIATSIGVGASIKSSHYRFFASLQASFTLTRHVFLKLALNHPVVWIGLAWLKARTNSRLATITTSKLAAHLWPDGGTELKIKSTSWVWNSITRLMGSSSLKG